MNIAVIGAGCGGQAVAGYAASQGHKVNLYNRSINRIESLMPDKKIKLIGDYQSEGTLNKVTTDISEAVEDAELLMVVTTATGHQDIAKKLAPHLHNNQTIVLNPGRTFGALEFLNTLLTEGCKADVNIAEANTLIYATRILESGISDIKGVKSSVAFASLPYHKSQEICDKINELYPQFYLEKNFLITSVGNIGTVFHPTVMLLNKERVKKGDNFEFYTEGATRTAVDYMKKVDEERINIGSALGVSIQSLEDWLIERYDLDKNQDLYDLLHNNWAYQGISAPKTLNMRYLTEDVPTGLVPLSEVGDALGIKTPYINNLIDIASKELSTNFKYDGRTLEKLGLNKETIMEDFEKLFSINKISEYKNNLTYLKKSA